MYRVPEQQMGEGVVCQGYSMRIECFWCCENTRPHLCTIGNDKTPNSICWRYNWRDDLIQNSSCGYTSISAHGHGKSCIASITLFFHGIPFRWDLELLRNKWMCAKCIIGHSYNKSRTKALRTSIIPSISETSISSYGVTFLWLILAPLKETRK